MEKKRRKDLQQKVKTDPMRSESVYETQTTHTFVLAVKLSEGTEEVRLVRKQLLPQDSESWALGSPNTADDERQTQQRGKQWLSKKEAKTVSHQRQKHFRCLICEFFKLIM